MNLCGQPVVIGANGTATLPYSVSEVRSFLAKTAGTLTITNSAGVTVLDAFPVAAGTQYDLFMVVRADKNPQVYATVVCAGGASGTLIH